MNSTWLKTLFITWASSIYARLIRRSKSWSIFGKDSKRIEFVVFILIGPVLVFNACPGQHKISPVHPIEYAERFFSFLTAVMRGGGGGERFKAE